MPMLAEGSRSALYASAARRSSVWPIAPSGMPRDNPRMALEDSELELRHDDYAAPCREAGVEPLTSEALQRFIDVLTHDPTVATIH